MKQSNRERYCFDRRNNGEIKEGRQSTKWISWKSVAPWHILNLSKLVRKPMFPLSRHEIACNKSILCNIQAFISCNEEWNSDWTFSYITQKNSVLGKIFWRLCEISLSCHNESSEALQQMWYCHRKILFVERKRKCSRHQKFRCTGFSVQWFYNGSRKFWNMFSNSCNKQNKSQWILSSKIP